MKKTIEYGDTSTSFYASLESDDIKNKDDAPGA